MVSSYIHFHHSPNVLCLPVPASVIIHLNDVAIVLRVSTLWSPHYLMDRTINVKRSISIVLLSELSRMLYYLHSSSLGVFSA